jgi:hypothetical protein
MGPPSLRFNRWLVCATAVAMAGACSTFDGLVRAPEDAEGGVSNARSTLSCANARVPPARKPNALPQEGGLPDLVFAVDMIDFGSGFDDAGNPSYESIGYDIACSDNDGAATCEEPAWAYPPDHPLAGIDNAVERYAGHAPGQYVLPTLMYDGTPGGNPTMIYRISGFSGDKDDDQVTVSAYVGLQVGPREDDGGTPPDADAPGAVTAVWDGQDRWVLHPDMLLLSADGGQNVDQPKYRDDHAYVSGGVLVAHFSELLRPAGLASMPSVLSLFTRSIVTGRLVQMSDGSWKIDDGITEERDPLTQALKIFSRNPPLGDPTGNYACQSPDQYKALWTALCPYTDVSSGTEGLSSPCDALSSGSSWTAKPALLGSIASLAPVPLPQCDPTIDPDTDSCEALESQ